MIRYATHQELVERLGAFRKFCTLYIAGFVRATIDSDKESAHYVVTIDEAALEEDLWLSDYPYDLTTTPIPIGFVVGKGRRRIGARVRINLIEGDVV